MWNWRKKNIEKEKDNTDEFIPMQPSAKREWRLRINYQWIVHNLPFILFLSLLALIYIANGHYTDQTVRRINETGRDVKELRWKYLDVKSDLMFRSKMSEVSKAVAPLGLKELQSPPIKIAPIQPDK